MNIKRQTISLPGGSEWNYDKGNDIYSKELKDIENIQAQSVINTIYDKNKSQTELIYFENLNNNVYTGSKLYGNIKAFMKRFDNFKRESSLIENECSVIESEVIQTNCFNWENLKLFDIVFSQIYEEVNGRTSEKWSGKIGIKITNINKFIALNQITLNLPNNYSFSKNGSKVTSLELNLDSQDQTVEREFYLLDSINETSRTDEFIINVCDKSKNIVYTTTQQLNQIWIKEQPKFYFAKDGSAEHSGCFDIGEDKKTITKIKLYFKQNEKDKLSNYISEAQRKFNNLITKKAEDKLKFKFSYNLALNNCPFTFNLVTNDNDEIVIVKTVNNEEYYIELEYYNNYISDYNKVRYFNDIKFSEFAINAYVVGEEEEVKLEITNVDFNIESDQYLLDMTIAWNPNLLFNSIRYNTWQYVSDAYGNRLVKSQITDQDIIYYYSQNSDKIIRGNIQFFVKEEYHDFFVSGSDTLNEFGNKEMRDNGTYRFYLDIKNARPCNPYTGDEIEYLETKLDEDRTASQKKFKYYFDYYFTINPEGQYNIFSEDVQIIASTTNDLDNASNTQKYTLGQYAVKHYDLDLFLLNDIENTVNIDKSIVPNSKIEYSADEAQFKIVIKNNMYFKPDLKLIQTIIEQGKNQEYVINDSLQNTNIIYDDEKKMWILQNNAVILNANTNFKEDTFSLQLYLSDNNNTSVYSSKYGLIIKEILPINYKFELLGTNYCNIGNSQKHYLFDNGDFDFVITLINDKTDTEPADRMIQILANQDGANMHLDETPMGYFKLKQNDKISFTGHYSKNNEIGKDKQYTKIVNSNIFSIPINIKEKDAENNEVENTYNMYLDFNPVISFESIKWGWEKDTGNLTLQCKCKNQTNNFSTGNLQLYCYEENQEEKTKRILKTQSVLKAQSIIELTSVFENNDNESDKFLIVNYFDNNTNILNLSHLYCALNPEIPNRDVEVEIVTPDIVYNSGNEVNYQAYDLNVVVSEEKPKKPCNGTIWIKQNKGEENKIREFNNYIVRKPTQQIKSTEIPSANLNVGLWKKGNTVNSSNNTVGNTNSNLYLLNFSNYEENKLRNITITKQFVTANQDYWIMSKSFDASTALGSTDISKFQGQEVQSLNGYQTYKTYVPKKAKQLLINTSFISENEQYSYLQNKTNKEVDTIMLEVNNYPNIGEDESTVWIIPEGYVYLDNKIYLKPRYCCHKKNNKWEMLYSQYYFNNKWHSLGNFGIERDVNSLSPNWTRIGASKNFEAHGSKGYLHEGWSDFDNALIYKDIVEFYKPNTINSVINNLNTTYDSVRAGEEYYIFIPKFYYKREIKNGIERIVISPEKEDGLQLHPAFYRNGKEINGFQIGKYPLTINSINKIKDNSVENAKISIAQTVRQNSTVKKTATSQSSISKAVLAQNYKATATSNFYQIIKPFIDNRSEVYSNDGYIYDIIGAKEYSAIQMLYLVEYATYDTILSLGLNPVDVAISSTAVISYSDFIPSNTDKNTKIGIAGVDQGDKIITNNLNQVSGSIASNATKPYSRWRHIDLLWGVLPQVLKDIEVTQGFISLLDEDKTIQISYSLPTTPSGLIVKFGLDTEQPWLMLPSSVISNSTTYSQGATDWYAYSATAKGNYGFGASGVTATYTLFVPSQTSNTYSRGLFSGTCVNYNSRFGSRLIRYEKNNNE